MNLSYKHIAIFGQVKVDVNSLDANLASYVTLLDLYKDGWWVTDRFGTIITIVKPKSKLKDGFCCVCRRISTNVNLNTLDLLTKQIADAKYEEHKHYLQSKKYNDKVKKSKERFNDTNLSTLPQRNKSKQGVVLLTPQRRNPSGVSRKN